MPTPSFILSTSDKPWQTRPLTPAQIGQGGKRSARITSLASVAAPDLRVTAGEDQKWWGFGGCFNELGWSALSTLTASRREAVIGNLFDPQGDGCRFNWGRLPIGASDYAQGWYSLNETPDDFAMKRFSIQRDKGCLIPYIRSALAFRKDLKLFASPWSPPTWLKNPPVYNYGRLIRDEKHLRAYALYFVKFLKAYAAQGVDIRQLHVQNEPEADQKFPSCLWTGGEMRDFIRDYLGPALAQAKLDADIWVGTINSADHDQWALTPMLDPGARKYIRGIGYQWAGKGAVQRTHQAFPDLPLMQTENECGDGKNTWDYAHYVFQLLQHYLTNGVNAYVYWNMILAPGGASAWGWRQNALITVDPKNKTVTYNPEYHLMRHFSACIQPGAVRRILQGAWSANSVAFANPDGTTAIILANPLGEEHRLKVQAGGQQYALQLPARSFASVVV